MEKVIKIKSLNNNTIKFFDKMSYENEEKNIYYTIDKLYIISFYKKHLSKGAKKKLETIVGFYQRRIFNHNNKYWNDLFLWPIDIVIYNGRFGIVTPILKKCFYFKYGLKKGSSLKNKNKKGLWFASANIRNNMLDERELGDWLSYLRICILISRAIRKLHELGLVHPDLSYNNILIDPISGNICVMDIDNLIISNNPVIDSVATHDFIAPEIIKTELLHVKNPKKITASIETNRHSLSILIYMYLLYRHPLRGCKVHNSDDITEDEKLSMGKEALFIEHPSDKSNTINIKQANSGELPWIDINKLPYTITGPYLSKLFLKSFVDGLHEPSKRPSANDWELALIKTYDLMQPCENKMCKQKWYVFDKRSPHCPFCGAVARKTHPVLKFYSKKSNKYMSDQHHLAVWDGLSLYLWHVNNNIYPNEKITGSQKGRVGYFIYYANHWWFVNERLANLKDITNDRDIGIGDKIKLTNSQKILLSKDTGGRLVTVTII